MHRVIFILFIGLFTLTSLAPAEAQIFGSKKDKKEQKKKKKNDKNGIKDYDEVITDKSKTMEGLFTTHRVDNKWYFELGDSLLEEEILVVSRISGYVKDFSFGGAGMKSRPQQVIRFQKHGDNILIRSVSYSSVADMEDPIYTSVKNNNFEPIIHNFDLKAIGKDSASYVIDVTEFFKTDVPMIGPLSDAQRKRFKIKGLDKKRCLIQWMKSFPENVEVRHVLTYKGDNLPDNEITESLTLEMNQSFILLPEEPMQKRFYDPRVGYFSIEQVNYSLDEQEAAKRRYITRWRLVPKDPEAYARGDLVEPEEPIVYYIDPATPKKWRPYLKQGVEDWQDAFEEIGFKNAILAKDPPSEEEHPDWSPEDVRYSVIRYVSTEIQNAMGPHVHDPRTGEILESDIIWYHNVMNLLRNWYFVQTAAVNPAARSVKFREQVMGELIRFVSAHEVGHTLGLPHNMGSSSAYPIDSLRSPSFMAEHGTAPSIMDYARFNYVAQPEDSVTNLHPAIGPYDKWSVKYGYQWIPGAETAEEAEPILNEWIRDRADDPVYRYGRQRRDAFDPSAQTEDLGDDPVEASRLGIENLKRIVPNLIQWTFEEGEEYEELDELYQQVLGQYGRYMRHVRTQVGGVYEQQRTYTEGEVVYRPVPAKKQHASLEFLNEQLFETPEWMIDTTIFRRIDEKGFSETLLALQKGTLMELFDSDRIERIAEYEGQKENAFRMEDLFKHLQSGIWDNLNDGEGPDSYERQLQRTYVDHLAKIALSGEDTYETSGAAAWAQWALETIGEEAGTLASQTGDLTDRVHYRALQRKVNRYLDPSFQFGEGSK